MSFDDYHSFGAPSSSRGSRTTAPFEYSSELPTVSPARSRFDTESISQNIAQISSHISQLRRLCNQLGTSKDSPELRKQINSLIETTKEIAKQTSEDLRNLDVHSGTWEEKNRKRIVQQKLMKDFQSYLEQFQELSRLSAKQERAAPPPPSKTHHQKYQAPHQAQTFEELGFQESLVEHDHLQMENEISTTDMLISERDSNIKEIEKSVLEVNEIFIDLSNLVSEQGHMIDNIEQNVEVSVSSTSRGLEEVRKASKYQRSARGKLCVLALLLTIIAAVIVVVIWLFVVK